MIPEDEIEAAVKVLESGLREYRMDWIMEFVDAQESESDVFKQLAESLRTKRTLTTRVRHPTKDFHPPSHYLEIIDGLAPMMRRLILLAIAIDRFFLAPAQWIRTGQQWVVGVKPGIPSSNLDEIFEFPDPGAIRRLRLEVVRLVSSLADRSEDTEIQELCQEIQSRLKTQREV